MWNGGPFLYLKLSICCFLRFFYSAICGFEGTWKGQDLQQNGMVWSDDLYEHMSFILFGPFWIKGIIIYVKFPKQKSPEKLLKALLKLPTDQILFKGFSWSVRSKGSKGDKFHHYQSFCVKIMFISLQNLSDNFLNAQRAWSKSVHIRSFATILRKPELEIVFWIKKCFFDKKKKKIDNLQENWATSSHLLCGLVPV